MTVTVNVLTDAMDEVAWPSPRVLVLGLGNPLLGDDGAGLRMLEGVEAAGPWPANVRLVDGGTWGMSLLPDVIDAERLLVLDAVRTGREPGTVVRGEDDAVPRWYSHPVSPHQVDLREVLGAAELLEALPTPLVVVGIEPHTTDALHVGLTDAVEAAIARAVAEGVRVLRELAED
jgi:hydrogenase maturation protease